MADRLRTTLVAIVAITALAAGCGGADDGNGSSASGGDGDSVAAPVTTAQISKAEFVRKAEAACRAERKETLDKVNAYIKRHEDDGKPPQELYADMFRAVMVPTVEAEIASVSKLGAPAGDEELLAGIYAEQEDALDRVRELKRVQSVEDFEDNFSEVDVKLRAYGLQDCTNTPDPALEG